jgi:acyl carrier protein
MKKEEILKQIIQTVHESNPDIDVSTLSENTNFSETGIDSMGFMLIVCKIESRFDIKIPDEQWQKLTTMRDLMDEIQKCMDQKGLEGE